ncbi:MAG: nucleoside-triphosphatase [Coriobacteriia bacterium]|nr:nucleoside-triphosphatase [Coriobacteriia bacterium]
MRSLFFEGNIQIGKSSCLRQLLRNSKLKVSGFAVVRIIHDQALLGFSIETLKTSIPPVNEVVRHRDAFLEKHNVFDTNVVTTVLKTVRDEMKTSTADALLLDEIGGREMLDEEIMALYKEILTGPLPCIGILKAERNLLKPFMSDEVKSTLINNRNKLIHYIEADGLVVDVADNPEKITGYFEKWMSANHKKIPPKQMFDGTSHV